MKLFKFTLFIVLAVIFLATTTYAQSDDGDDEFTLGRIMWYAKWPVLKTNPLKEPDEALGVEWSKNCVFPGSSMVTRVDTLDGFIFWTTTGTQMKLDACTRDKFEAFLNGSVSLSQFNRAKTFKVSECLGASSTPVCNDDKEDREQCGACNNAVMLSTLFGVIIAAIIAVIF